MTTDLNQLREIAEMATEGAFTVEADEKGENGERLYNVLFGDPEKNDGLYYVPEPDATCIATFSPSLVLAMLEVVEKADDALHDYAERSGPIIGSMELLRLSLETALQRFEEAK